ncbi:MAG: alpha-ketoglutarate-dependent dioxygenase AlkB [Paracoccaceae bacterium]|nr:alpha-ketoglutarate-dependent dioxygenase AlkB [Paracoccaceae bacterium]MDG1738254.1 alpha-ketoglutarate-dependent dioxygenase AlkB [Paracoccaceae bacterium]MDG2260465.1 alpha-ketoglutarate-dependent dioxygenase AlkB [Paracoccaceae bacterium]
MSEWLNINGARILPDYLSRPEQESLVEELRELARIAPFRRLKTPSGKQMSVRTTAAGHFGWSSDARGYRYDAKQSDGSNWPPIPTRLLDMWDELASTIRKPQSCLINYYGESTKMGMHQDKDEDDFTQPVLSLSLGDEALFRVGGRKRSDKTASVWLRSGDVAILDGNARMAYHGIERTRFGSSRLLKDGGRLNLTLRVVT